MKNNIRIFEKMGIEKQFPIWVEEMAELTQALSKYMRLLNEENTIEIQNKLFNAEADIIEEYVDVCICLEQIKHKFAITENDFKIWYDYKIKRQMKRVGLKNE